MRSEPSLGACLTLCYALLAIIAAVICLCVAMQAGSFGKWPWQYLSAVQVRHVQQALFKRAQAAGCAARPCKPSSRDRGCAQAA